MTLLLGLSHNAPTGSPPAAPTAINKSLGDASGNTVVLITVADSSVVTYAKVCGALLTSFSAPDGTHVQGTTAAMTASATPGSVVVGNTHGDSPALASAFEAFWPTNIPGCKCWLRADIGVTLNGSSHVTKWADQSGNGNDVTGSGTWTKTASWTNGKPALRSDNATSLQNTATNLVTAGAARSVFTVLDSASLGGGGTGGGIFTFRLGGFVCSFMNLWVGVDVIYRDNVITNLTCTGNPTAAFSSPTSVDVEYGGTGTAPVYNINGVDPGGIGATTNDDTGTTGFEVGALSAASQFWDGNIAEVAAHDHAYSAPELARLVLYRKDRYGLAA